MSSSISSSYGKNLPSPGCAGEGPIGAIQPLTGCIDSTTKEVIETQDIVKTLHESIGQLEDAISPVLMPCQPEPKADCAKDAGDPSAGSLTSTHAAIANLRHELGVLRFNILRARSYVNSLRERQVVNPL